MMMVMVMVMVAAMVMVKVNPTHLLIHEALMLWHVLISALRR